MSPERTPVIIGVGQIDDRENVHDSLELMVRAIRRADADANANANAGARWIAEAGSLATIAQISFPELGDTAAALATRLGIAPAHCAQTPYPTGEGPLQLLHEAANRIGAGEIEVALVVGAEALRTAAARRQTSDAVRSEAIKTTPRGLARYGLVAPTDLYPLYENASRAAWGQTLAQAQAESGEIWAGMSRVAAANPDAWLQTTMTADEIVEPCSDNRLIAFPYTKRMVANAAVNMGAGFIVTSLARARAAGIGEDRIIHVGASAAGHEPLRITDWDRYDRSPSMIASIQGAMARGGVTVDDLDHVELYSCFPCIPKMARRVFGWPVERPMTAFGGLTFGGAPVGNYMSHAVAAMVQRLRGSAETALLFANGGYATHSHATLLSGAPTGTVFPHDADIMADCVRDAVPPTLDRWEGPARIETYTVFYNRDGSARTGTVIARTPQGARVVMTVDDATDIAFLVQGDREPVGTMGRARTDADGLIHWTQ